MIIAPVGGRLPHVRQELSNTIRVSQTEIMQHPRRNHITIQPKREGNNRGHRIHGNTKRHAWPTPSSTNLKQDTRETTIKT